MKACFIGLCGHSMRAYQVMKARGDIELCGVAPGSEHENMTGSFDVQIPFFASYTEMLDTVKPDLAVVSPVFALVGQVTLACAARGIHVFAEKPVASSMEELAAVEKAVSASGIRFLAMHYLRYDPAFYHGAQLVREGAIGDVRLITAQKSYRYGQRPVWYQDRALYGGTIPWVGIHGIDWIYHFGGKQFLSVTAHSFGSPEMAALCHFEMEDGVMASLNIDYYRPQTAPTHGDDRVRCAGTEGVLEVSESKIRLINSQGDRVVAPPAPPEMFAEFLDGKTPISKEEIFYLTYISLAARDAADTGETIRTVYAL